MKKYILMSCVLLSIATYAQTALKGKVVVRENGKEIGAFGANVFWKNTSIGVTTDEDGNFTIEPLSDKTLIVSFMGYHTFRLENVNPQKKLRIELEKDAQELEAVEVEQRQKSAQKFKFQTANVLQLNGGELKKAACCNLSESFQTNSSVDVSTTDAVTGTKQIKMLGLSSPYIMMTQENIPSIRGASQVYGMNFVPGTWIKNIQIIKGAGSVINGYESIAGQINTELMEPFEDVPFFVNVFGSAEGRMELNTHFNQQVSEHWYAGFYAHGNYNSQRNDNNNDGFMDIPIGSQVNLMNRWQYMNMEKGIVSNIKLHYLTDERISGQMDFDKNLYSPSYNVWGSQVKVNQWNATTKLGYVWEDMPFQSIGWQTDYKYYDQKSYYGRNQYDIQQDSGYTNLIFSSIIGNTMRKFITGMSANFDHYRENIGAASLQKDFSRTDYGVGGFFEYTYDNTVNFSWNVGLRADWNNRLGFFVTPRLHLKYIPWEKGVVRLSAGQGRRIANVLAENQRLFATSRSIELPNKTEATFGLLPERAWNYGVSVSQELELANNPLNISLDFYRTEFENQVVLDWENPRKIAFYNLEGKSFANSFQAELDYELLRDMTLRMAYKYYDVQIDYRSGRKAQPLQAPHRFFVNWAYATPNRQDRYWRFDYTFHWVGSQRLPSTQANPVAYQLGSESKPFHLSSAQITRVFSKRLEVYLGMENIGNYQQERAILDAEHPFGNCFDSSILYAPTLGRMLYGGLRFHLEKKQ